MKNMKKILTVCLAAMMLVAVLSFSASAATKFADVSENDETLVKAVSLLEGMGITKGTSETTFGTYEPVTRQQMAAFLYRLAKSGKSLEGGKNTTAFTDLYDDTYYSMISWANGLGYIKGTSETTFNPDGSITLQDAYTMLVRLLDYGKDLGYPYDYIDIAESEGVELDKGLHYSITYDTELTRGNVAVLLYNAFFAKTGIAETVERPRLIGSGENKRYVLETVQEYPKFCEKVYDIIEERFQVRETTHYAFNDAKADSTYKPTQDVNGEGTMLLVAVEPNQKVESVYFTTADLGLSEDADDYIMSEIALFYSYDDVKKEIKNVYYAESQMETVSGRKATYGSYNKKMTAANAAYFYEVSGSRPTGYPKMNGSITVSGNTMYFYDAPYTFLEPSYENCLTEADRYDARNSDNTKLINLKAIDFNKGLYSYYLTGEDNDFGPMDSGNNFVTMFTLLRTNGEYSMTIYDPDGDGRFEYMWYKPATLGRISMDDEHEFKNIAEHKTNAPVLEAVVNPTERSPIEIPMIYANGADLYGGITFKDEDFVAAYLNAEANMIEIMEVLTAKKGQINNANKTSATIKIGSQSFTTCYGINYFANFYAYRNVTRPIYPTSRHSSSAAFMGNTITGDLYSPQNYARDVILYLYNDKEVIFFEYLDDGSNIYSGEEILIPLETETRTRLNNSTLEYDQYLKVWVGGAVKYVPINVEDCYPQPSLTIDGTYTFDNTVTEPVASLYPEYKVYDNKLCTYTVDKNGLYVIRSLMHGKDEDGNDAHLNLIIDKTTFFDADEQNQAANDLGAVGGNEEAYIKKITSKRYKVVDANGYSLIGTYGTSATNAHWFDELYITEAAKIILRSKTVDVDGKVEYEYHVYSGADFPGTVEDTLPITNLQYIYQNYEDSQTRADLVLLYGEIDGELAFESKVSETNYRIIKLSNIEKDAEGDFRYYYDVFNPATGLVEERVPGAVSKSSAEAIEGVVPLAPGAVAKVNSRGEINDKVAAEYTLNSLTNENLAFLYDVDLNDNLIEIEAVNIADQDYFTVNSELHTMYELSEEVVISVLKVGKNNSFTEAEIALLTVEELAKGGKNILAYNDRIVGDNGEYKTEYANYPKIFITYSKKNSDEFPVVDTIMVIVNSGEPEGYLDI